MTNNQKTVSSIALMGAVFAVASVVGWWTSLQKDLYGRFPNHDRKVIRKAYRSFLKNSAAGLYGDIDPLTDEEMDALFMLEIVRVDIPSSK